MCITRADLNKRTMSGSIAMEFLSALNALWLNICVVVSCTCESANEDECLSVRTRVRACVRACMRACVHACVRACVRTVHMVSIRSRVHTNLEHS